MEPPAVGVSVEGMMVMVLGLLETVMVVELEVELP
jgi:hypothetical protein